MDQAPEHVDMLQPFDAAADRRLARAEALGVPADWRAQCVPCQACGGLDGLVEMEYSIDDDMLCVWCPCGMSTHSPRGMARQAIAAWNTVNTEIGDEQE